MDTNTPLTNPNNPVFSFPRVRPTNSNYAVKLQSWSLIRNLSTDVVASKLFDRVSWDREENFVFESTVW